LPTYSGRGPYRKQGIADWILNHVYSEYQSMEISPLSPATEHASFDAHYGRTFHCLTQEKASTTYPYQKAPDKQEKCCKPSCLQHFFYV
jgi:hypothetical protein